MSNKKNIAQWVAVTTLCAVAYTGIKQSLAETKPAENTVTPIDESSAVLPIQESFSGPVTLPNIQHHFDVFSWQSFIALNWPANKAGEADQNILIGERPGATTVWQNYKESRDIFLPDGATPLPWGETSPLPIECKAAGDKPVLVQAGKTRNVLDESGEPFKTGPLIDQNGQYTRYEILTNQIMFEYITGNNLYSKVGQAGFMQAADFPKGVPAESADTSEKIVDGTYGSIMVKAAWKVIGEGDDTGKFHTVEAYVYNNPHENSGVKAKCTLQQVGLVGLHIATKTESSSQWIWSTFEHVDNVPTQGQTPDKPYYNYHKPNCDDCTEVNTPPERPWNPAIPHTQPSQIERVIPIDDDTKLLNAQYQKALTDAVPGSVWANYELISTQWPTNSTSPTDPTGAPAPPFLANTTLETYIPGSIPRTSSSCIQCHSDAAATNGKFSDFTYLLQRAQ